MSQIRPITQGEIEPCMALKKNAYPALDIDPAVNRERILQGIRDPCSRGGIDAHDLMMLDL